MYYFAERLPAPLPVNGETAFSKSAPGLALVFQGVCFNGFSQDGPVGVGGYQAPALLFTQEPGRLVCRLRQERRPGPFVAGVGVGGDKLDIAALQEFPGAGCGCRTQEAGKAAGGNLGQGAPGDQVIEEARFPDKAGVALGVGDNGRYALQLQFVEYLDCKIRDKHGRHLHQQVAPPPSLMVSSSPRLSPSPSSGSRRYSAPEKRR